MKKLSLFLVALTMILFSCKPEVEKPTVVTKSVGEVTETTAKVVGQVTADGGAEVTERGICWSTKQNPTIEDDKTEDGSGVGTFASEMTDLEADTKYYVRAYATNEKGTAYGEEVSFTTEEVEEPEQPEDPENPEQPEDPENPEQPEDPENPEQPEDPENPEQPVGPVVTTAEVTNITVNSAECGGEVVSGGDAVVVARGVCWNTTGAPTVSDTYTMDGTNVGVFTSGLSNLESNTAYYVRAYATDAKGVTSYGEEVSFTTLEKLLPTVTTAREVTNITVSSATCGGEVTFDGNVEVIAKGVCWSTTQNPTIEDNKTTDGTGVGIFTSNLSNLEQNRTYYVRAYATNEAGTAYGKEVNFTTLEEESLNGTENGHEYVDLGLSVKWATCNVGATTPEEYGDYYAWGETSTKETYDYYNCATYRLSYTELQSQGYIDSEGKLTPQYDAATINWGGEWRMPTDAEMQELRDNCTWTWITQNGVNGCNVEGPNGNSIFLPAAGVRGGSSLYYAGSDGLYSSSTPDECDGDDYAYFLGFDSGNHFVNSYRRLHGLSVRSVLE